MNKQPCKAQNINTETSPPASRLRSLWLGACARFTLLCLFMLVTSAIASDSLTITYVDTVHFFLLLPFGLCLTLAAWVRRSPKLGSGAKVGLHALCTLGGFYLFGYLPYQVRTKPSGMQILLILLATTLVYALVMGIYAAVTAKTREREREETPYESQFRKD
ncbi:MAG: hypothetical protein IKM33_01950 [Clostridia bacterium]|nr:hypothetical protein [Clostridia bacterium]